jgi:predicted GTPase
MIEAARISCFARVTLNNCFKELWAHGVRTFIRESDKLGWLVLYESDSTPDKVAKMAEIAFKHGAEFWQNPIASASPE